MYNKLDRFGIMCYCICMKLDRLYNKLLNAPLLDPEKRKDKHLIARLGFAALSLFGAYNAARDAVHLGENAVNAVRGTVNDELHGPTLTKQQIQADTKSYTVQPGDTVWSIASAEGQSIANNPEKLYKAEQNITAQIPGKNPNNLQPGEQILLAGSSAIGHPIHKSN